MDSVGPLIVSRMNRKTQLPLLVTGILFQIRFFGMHT